MAWVRLTFCWVLEWLACLLDDGLVGWLVGWLGGWVYRSLARPLANKQTKSKRVTWTAATVG
jgi:hypothetical protein